MSIWIKTEPSVWSQDWLPPSMGQEEEVKWNQLLHRQRKSQGLCKTNSMPMWRMLLCTQAVTVMSFHTNCRIYEPWGNLVCLYEMTNLWWTWMKPCWGKNKNTLLQFCSVRQSIRVSRLVLVSLADCQSAQGRVFFCNFEKDWALIGFINVLLE